MKKSGIPGMAVAVVHGGKTVYAKGFGVKDVRKRTTKGGPRHGVPAGVAVQAAGRDGGRPSGRRERDRLGHARSSRSCRGSRCPIRWSRRWSPSATCSRTAPGCPTTPATCSRTSATTAATCSNGCAQLPLDPFRISYAYTNFGLTAGAEAVAVGAGKSWEDLADEVLYRPLGMTSTSSGSPTTRPGRTAPSATSTSTAATSRCYVRDPRRRRRPPAASAVRRSTT